MRIVYEQGFGTQRTPAQYCVPPPLYGLSSCRLGNVLVFTRCLYVLAASHKYLLLPGPRAILRPQVVLVLGSYRSGKGQGSAHGLAVELNLVRNTKAQALPAESGTAVLHRGEISYPVHHNFSL